MQLAIQININNITTYSIIHGKANFSKSKNIYIFQIRVRRKEMCIKIKLDKME